MLRKERVWVCGTFDRLRKEKERKKGEREGKL